jgi:hypothetical protein
MKDPRDIIHTAFERRGLLTERDFDWLKKFLAQEQKKKPGAVELLSFSVYNGGAGVVARLQAQLDAVPDVWNVLLSDAPVPYAIEVLNQASPNPGSVIMTISWGEV